MHWAGNRWTAAVVNLFAVRPAMLSMPAELDIQKLAFNSYNNMHICSLMHKAKTNVTRLMKIYHVHTN